MVGSVFVQMLLSRAKECEWSHSKAQLPEGLDLVVVSMLVLVGAIIQPIETHISLHLHPQTPIIHFVRVLSLHTSYGNFCICEFFLSHFVNLYQTESGQTKVPTLNVLPKKENQKNCYSVIRGLFCKSAKWLIRLKALRDLDHSKRL